MKKRRETEQPDVASPLGAAAELDEHAAELEALRAAHAPGELDAEVHEAILARVLGAEAAPADTAHPALEGPGHPATEDERRRAEDLRRALAGEPSSDEAESLVRVARALRHAHAPAPIVEIRHAALLRDALRDRSRPLRWASGIAGALAAAAAIALLVQGNEPARESDGLALVPARSTVELFDPAEPFPRSGEETARIDKIASARASDLRANRFARWGVR